MRRYQLGLLIIICLSILLTSCGSEPQKKPELPGPKIGVQLALVEKDIAEIIKKEMQSLAEEEKLQLVWEEPASEYATLEKNLDDLINQKVQAVIMQFPPDELSLDFAKKILEQDIKLLAIGSLPFDIPVDGYIAPDNYRLGELQGQYVVDELQKKDVNNAKVILVEMDQNDNAFSQMTQGTLSVLEEREDISLEIREIKLSEFEMASAIVEREILTREDLSALVIQGSALAAEVSQTLNNLADKKVITVGLGAGKEASTLIAAGFHNAEADPMPEMLARTAFKAAADLVNNDTWQYDTQIANGSYDVPAKILPVRLIKAENLFLLKERWGELNSEKNTSSQSQAEDLENDEEEGKEESQEGKNSTEDKQSEGKVTLKIKTKDGQTLEVDLPGEIEEMEIKGAADNEEQTQSTQ